jgi:uncharacterized protein (TIGR03437 family)
MPSNNNGLQSRYTALRTSAYIGRLDMNLSGTAALTYSSYFNGTINNTAIAHLFLDPNNSVVFCGSTTSDIPSTEIRLQNYAGFNPARSTGAGFTSGDAFIARINPAVAGAASLTYSSWVGGSDVDFASSCGLDSRGNFVVSGSSLSLQFLAAGSPVPYRLGIPGATGISGFLIRIDPTRQQGRVGTILFGGSGTETPNAMAIDSKGFAYIGGYTDSKLYPSSANALQPTYGGDTLSYAAGGCCGDAFLMQADLNAEQVPVAALQSLGSDFLFGNPGAANPVTVSARLIDANGNPMALHGYIIEFKSTNAQFAHASVLTDGTGTARTTAQVTGAEATVAVTSATLPSLAPLNLRIRTTTGALPRAVAIVSGDKQSGRAGAALAQPLVLEMRDANNAPLAIAGFTVQLRLVNATATSTNLVTDNNGRVSTTITLGPSSGEARVEVLLGSLAPVTATFTVSGGRPTISSGGVVSAATFQSGGVSPGLIVTLFGSGIGPDALLLGGADESGKFPTQLGGTSVLFDGVPAPVVYASAGQTSVIVPYAVAGKASTQVTVSKDGNVSAAQTVVVVPTQLGLFSANSSGSGQGALLNQDSSINSASNPAKRGSIVILYGTGEGVTSPAGVDGQLALSVYPKPTTPVTVKIGGRDAEVLYYGAAPTLVAGVLQLNVRVPAGLADGNQPIQLTAGTRQSPATITLAIAGDQ